RRHTRSKRDWSSDVCSSDLDPGPRLPELAVERVQEQLVELPHWSPGLGLELEQLPHVAVERPDMGEESVALQHLHPGPDLLGVRSEERRVGKEARARMTSDH